MLNVPTQHPANKPLLKRYPIIPWGLLQFKRGTLPPVAHDLLIVPRMHTAIKVVQIMGIFRGVFRFNPPK